MEEKDEYTSFETLLNNIDVAIINCGLEGKYQLNYCNAAFYNLIGYTPEQFENEHNSCAKEIICDEDIKELDESFKNQVETKAPCRNTYRIKKRDGSVIWVLEIGMVISAENGRTNFYGMLTDVSEERKSRELLMKKNEELLISEKRYELAMENSNESIFDYDIKEKKIVFAAAAAKKLNIPHIIENVIDDLTSTGLVGQNGIDNIKSLIEKIEDGQPYANTEAIVSFKNGNEIIFEIFVRNIYDKNDKPVKAVGIIRNISEKKMLEKERQYRMSMTSDKVYANEVNFTKNIITDTNNSWAKIVGIPSFGSITEMVEYMCDNLIHQSYTDVFKNFFDKDKVEESLKNGKTQIVAEYRRKNSDSSYNWIENTMNIIRDDVTGDIKARLYICMINERKEREIKAQEEQFFYDAMLINSINVYEANLTKDILVRGNSFWRDKFELEPKNSFTETMAEMTAKIIHPDDVHIVKNNLYRKCLIDGFLKGVSEKNLEFRRTDGNGGYSWVSCAVHLFEDPETGDIKGFSYVQDINDKKLKEIELLYKAEHDTLTDCNNKDTTERLITEYLNSNEGESAKHAFIIFDIDRFKMVNDTFGHIFGDAILSKVSQKTKELFRDDDIMGRIGGDEFVVFMKNISTHKTALSRAQEICSSIKETYTLTDSDFVISASVGIAFYPMDGITYKELYRNSDIALYQAKESGRDKFCVYDKTMTSNVSSIRQIDDTNLIEGRSFEKNISDYVFRILHESCDKIFAINSVLELIGKHYNSSRVYVFENFDEGKVISNSFEWCNKEISHQKDNMQNIVYKNSADYKNCFDKTGVLFIKNVSDIPKPMERIFENRGIQQSVQFTIINKDMFSGLVGFDKCEENYKDLDKKDITDMRSIANILGNFIAEMRAVAYSATVKEMSLAIVNSFDTYAYVINRENYRFLFINDKMKADFSDINMTDFCYTALNGKSEPCQNCILNSENGREKYFDNIKRKLRITSCPIEWVGGVKANIIMAVDVTEHGTTL